MKGAWNVTFKEPSVELHDSLSIITFNNDVILTLGLNEASSRQSTMITFIFGSYIKNA
jgi:hypothetical protein